MNTKITIGLLSVVAATGAYSKGLYYVPEEANETIPLAWNVGVTAIYDDNTSPGGDADGDESFAINPFVGVSFVNATPQTTWNVYAKIGVIYYFDEPAGLNDQNFFGQSELGVNLTHRFSERLRLVSRNFISYELEPNVSLGFAATRQLSEFLYYESDQAIGYRWTERFATYTGVGVKGLIFDDLDNSDRFTWSVYNQVRYQLTPRTVITSTYRYSQTTSNGVASDSTNQFATVGLEHRFTPDTIVTAQVGAQFRNVDDNNGNTINPFVKLSLNHRVNQRFSLKGFLRYSAEDFDTVFGNPPVEFDNRLTLRLGLSGEYQLSPIVTIFGGLNLINTSFQDGRAIEGSGSLADESDREETLVNGFIGGSVKLTNNVYASASYNFTNSDSDNDNRNFQRNRISVGLNTEF